jgi:hypothetical protein
MAATEDDVPEGGKFEPETYAKARAQASTPSTFGQAFKKARADGDSTFTWQGKKYTTEMASAKKPASRNENYGNEGRGASTAKPYSGTKTVSKLDNPEPGLEESGPLESLLGPVKVAGGAAAAGVAALKAARAARAARAGKSTTDFSARRASPRNTAEETMAGEGGPNFKRGGKVSSASKRADGCATKGKTKGRVC